MIKKSLSWSKFRLVLTAEIILIMGIYSAIRLRWVCDDIFITFRYAKNWLDGLGIVYNAGEHVEGYTHFLWLCLITFFQKLGISPIDSSEWLGIGAYGTLLSIFLIISYRLTDKKNFYIPLTALILALHYDFNIWATGGLETSLFTLLISLSFYAICYMRTGRNNQFLLAGLFLTLAVLTRPDAIIFYVITFLFVIVRELIGGETPRKILSAALIFNSSVLVIYIPYLFWKVSYYGSFFPNTYYAKSGFASYYSQGFYYLYTYFKFYTTSLLFLLGIVYLFLVRGKSQGTASARIRELFRSDQSAPIILALAYILGYGIFFIAKVGGDFMYARFVIPLVPFFYFTAEASLRGLLRDSRVLLAGSFLTVLVLLYVDHSRRVIPFIESSSKNKDIIILSGDLKLGLNGIVDERWLNMRINPFTGLDLTSSAKQLGFEFKKYFSGKEIRVLIQGAQARLAYYAGFDYCIENYGLTDAYIAHLPLKERGRPGHERNAPNDYLVSKRINFMFGSFPQEYSGYQYIQFKRPNRDYPGAIITYDRELMRYLREKYSSEIRFSDFEEYLDGYIRGMKSIPAGQIKSDYKKFKDYYFSRNYDPGRERYFLERGEQ